MNLLFILRERELMYEIEGSMKYTLFLHLIRDHLATVEGPNVIPES